jgi:hypothetical protein
MGAEDGSLFDRSFASYCFTAIKKVGVGGFPILRDAVRTLISTLNRSIVLNNVNACPRRQAKNGLAGGANGVDLSLCRHVRGFIEYGPLTNLLSVSRASRATHACLCLFIEMRLSKCTYAIRSLSLP